MSNDTLTAKQRRYRKLRAAGLCVECGEKATDGNKCGRCRARARELANASYKQRSAERSAASECLRCGSKELVTKTHCEDCRQKVNAKNKRQDTQRRKQNKAAGGCVECGKKRARGVLLCQKHRDRQQEVAKRRRVAIRQEVLEHYGGKCVCCGETTTEFLQIDHVNDDGAEHRRKDPGAWRIYRWLKRNGFPAEGFQILCANCNWSKARYGYCPHQTRKSHASS